MLFFEIGGKISASNCQNMTVGKEKCKKSAIFCGFSQKKTK